MESNVQSCSGIHKRNLLNVFVLPQLGILLTVISSMMISLCYAVVKSLSSVSSSQLALYRFIGMFTSIIPSLIWSRQNVFPKTHRLNLFIQAVVGCVSMILEVYALQHMPLGDASVIKSSVPVFVFIFARVFLKENCSICTSVCLSFAICGIILVIRPSFLFGFATSSSYVEEKGYLLGAFAAVLSMLAASLLFVMTRLIKEVHCCVVMFNFSLVGVIFTTIQTYLLDGFSFPACAWEMFLIYILSTFSFTGQILFTKSLQLEEAGVVAVARRVDIVFAFIWQILFFDQYPETLSIAGSTLVMTSVVATLVPRWIESCPNIKKKIHFLI